MVILRFGCEILFLFVSVGIFLCLPQNCVRALLELHFSVRTTQHIMCATPPTVLGGFCSYSYTVTNMTWRWPLILWCCFTWVMGLLFQNSSLSTFHQVMCVYVRTFKVNPLPDCITIVLGKELFMGGGGIWVCSTETILVFKLKLLASSYFSTASSHVVSLNDMNNILCYDKMPVQSTYFTIQQIV